LNRDLLAYVDLDGRTVFCGRLWTRGTPRESASFEYDAGWLEERNAFALDPELPFGPGRFHTAEALFRAFTDPSPDRWGQTLLRRAERARARSEGRRARTLTAVDFLTLVADETRLGALRLRDARDGHEAPFLSSAAKPVPPLVLLRRLLSATNRIVANEETDDDLALVLAPGTSLGGARPKASVRGPHGELLIAKFPRKDDDWPVTRWEATVLSLAEAAGILVPRFRLELVLKKPVLLLHRFDREGRTRVPFMSAMTALSANDHESRSYLDIIDALRREGSRVTSDVRELWRRLVFNVLVSNTDDHLRNHGFLRDAEGWHLAPAYDMNPTPADVRPRIHSLAIDESEATASLETAFEVSPRFGITRSDARTIAREVGRVVRTWRTVGAEFGLKPKELERMESAFEHEDLERAK
jgi:serine/threonine-protein kinase HipA